MKRSLLYLIVLGFSGFLGGLTAGWINGGLVLASPGRTIDCQAIRFIDASGKKHGFIGIIDNEPRLVFADEHGNTGSLLVITAQGYPIFASSQERIYRY